MKYVFHCLPCNIIAMIIILIALVPPDVTVLRFLYTWYTHILHRYRFYFKIDFDK